MKDIDTELYVENLYKEALALDSSVSLGLDKSILSYITSIVNASENSKGVLAVTLTSMVYKALNPEQDIRCHQTSIEGGYSGRTFDFNYITPFLRAKSFPNMAESGWLTRSLEQKRPYTLDYPGAIKPQSLKDSFLSLLDSVQNHGIDATKVALALLKGLIIQRDSKRVELAKPQNLAISVIMDVLERHFTYSYKSRGTSRLPVLAFYAIYQSLICELKRYNGKTLLSLANHNSPDAQSGRLGDIDLTDEVGNPFEAIEVKHEIPISLDIVERVKEKILPSTVSRYYILSTAEIKPEDKTAIELVINQVKNSHGCQIVVNGIIPSLKYYLRLLNNPSSFIANYVSLLNSDETVKFEHKEAWNTIISAL